MWNIMDFFIEPWYTIRIYDLIMIYDLSILFNHDIWLGYMVYQWYIIRIYALTMTYNYDTEIMIYDSFMIYK